MLKLDKLREYLGFPLYINSAYRCPEDNKRVGGKDKSAHTKGCAVDIRASEKAREISLKQLKQWVMACAGNEKERLTMHLLMALKGKEFTASIGVQPARNGYGPKNVMRAFKAVEKTCLAQMI